MQFVIRLCLATAVLCYASFVSAAPINCGVNTTEDATANGAFADDCDYYSDTNIASTTEISDHVDSVWGSGGAFTYIGKYEKDGAAFESGSLDGFSLTVGEGTNGYMFSYMLEVPDAWVGQTVDWVLGIKQADNSFVSYLFEGVVLGIDGNFNNFWSNPKEKVVNDYSFAAGFIRTVSVPEPGTLALLSLGLAGLLAARRTRH